MVNNNHNITNNNNFNTANMTNEIRQFEKILNIENKDTKIKKNLFLSENERQMIKELLSKERNSINRNSTIVKEKEIDNYEEQKMNESNDNIESNDNEQDVTIDNNNTL